jgi:nucleoside 2-deoxyribosyltransferase
MKAYFAASLFTQAEADWNRRLAMTLNFHGLSVFLPQDEAIPFVDISIDPPNVDGRGIFHLNVDNLLESDVIIAALEGTDPDSGASWECGAAYIAEIPIIGIRSDFRKAGDCEGSPVNLQVGFSVNEWVFIKHSDDMTVTAGKIFNAVMKVTGHDIRVVEDEN